MGMVMGASLDVYGRDLPNRITQGKGISRSA